MTIAKAASEVLKTQVFLYEADTDRLENAYNKGNEYAKQLIESYSKAEFFTKLPEVEEEIDVVTLLPELVIFQQIYCRQVVMLTQGLTESFMDKASSSIIKICNKRFKS